MGEPGAPAVDPSYAWNSTGASGPTIASNTCASAMYIPSVYGRLTIPLPAANCLLAAAHGLVIEAEQPAVAVVLRLELVVGRAVVPAAELFFGVEGRGVQRLVPAKRADLFFHHPVVVTVALALRQRGRAPEAEVDVEVARVHGVQRPRLVTPQADGAHPDRRHLHLLGEERQELMPALDGDLHVLGDELPLRHAALRVHRGGEAVLLVDRDELPVDVRTPVLARPETADRLVFQAERARAPEPVGVPAPDVVLDREEVLAVPLQRLVVDLLAGVVAGPGRLIAER